MVKRLDTYVAEIFGTKTYDESHMKKLFDNGTKQEQLEF